MTSRERVKGIVSTIDRISEMEGKLASYLLVLATLQICLELLLRYVFRMPTIWGLEVSVYLCGVTYIMSGAYADRYDVHIRVDIFYSRWSKRTKAIVDLIFTDSLFLLFAVILVWHGGLWFMESWTENITSGTQWDPAIWPMRFLLLLGSFFLLLSCFSRIIKDLQTIFLGNRVAGNPAK